ncbi:MAG: hypothetical protein JW932_12865 [Deltaproteobacteria bacterium]|nr:hypothetical protein [Deltaproteobacteria bacterium]
MILDTDPNPKMAFGGTGGFTGTFTVESLKDLINCEKHPFFAPILKCLFLKELAELGIPGFILADFQTGKGESCGPQAFLEI